MQEFLLLKAYYYLRACSLAWPQEGRIMKHRVAFILLGVLLYSGSALFGASDPKPQDTTAKNRPAVVVVIAYDAAGNKMSQGSGFIARDDGTVITCWSNISGASKVKLVRKGGVSVVSDGIVAWDAARDFAVLRMPGKSLPTIALGDSDVVKKGDKVSVINSSGAAVASEGTISSVRMLPRAPILIQSTVSITPENSGGPVLNVDGQVVGVAVTLKSDSQIYNCIIPINTIKPRLALSGKILPFLQAAKENYLNTAECQFIKAILSLPDVPNAADSKKKVEAALALFQSAADRRKDYADAWFYIGYCLGELGRNEDAAKAFKTALKIRPEFAEAQFGLGLAAVKLGWNQDAVGAFKEAVRIKPDYADAYYNIGLAYINLGWNKESLESFNQAIKINPDYAEAYYNLGVAYIRDGLNQEAADSFKQVIRINPNQVQAQFGLGVADINMGMNKEAAEIFKQAIRIKPDYAEAHFGLGVAYLNQENNQEAVESFRQAIRLKPDDADSHYNLGLAYDKLGAKKEALESLKQATKLRPTYADAHFNLGAIYVSMDDRGNALDEYKTLKELDAPLAEKLFKLIYP